MNTLHVLDPSGDLAVTREPGDSASVAKARAEIQALKAAGFSFFLVDGTPADDVAAGCGTLNCRRITAEELIPELTEPEPAEEAPAAPVEAKRRGRPRKPAETPAETATGTVAVATRPLRGG